MKKTLSIILALVLALAALTGCGSSSTTATEATEAPAAETEATEAPAEEAADDSTAELEVIKVGASATPHAEILESVKDALAAEGYDLQVVVYDDYILPNQALADGELDANYFQHTPYLNSYNASNGTDLVAAALIHYEPFGIYANGVASLDELAEGATILIPADDSNETRALFLLQQEGLITLPEDASAEVGVSHLDIVDDGGYNIVPVQADTVPSQLASSDEGTIAVINGNYAIQAGLKVADALATEAADGDAAQTYANIIAVRNGDENSEKIQALINALKTDAVKQFIDDNYDGAVVAIF
jgi:D-methionine transport system substrate-binding protein